MAVVEGVPELVDVLFQETHNVEADRCLQALGRLLEGRKRAEKMNHLAPDTISAQGLIQASHMDLRTEVGSYQFG